MAASAANDAARTSAYGRNDSFDKGKPGESRRRKAMGLKVCAKQAHDCQAAENERFFVPAQGGQKPAPPPCLSPRGALVGLEGKMKRLAQCLITLSILIGLWLIGWPLQGVQAADGDGGYRVYLPAIWAGGADIPATGGHSEAILTLEAFAAQVADGQAGVVRGIYAEGGLAFRVDQQPPDNYLYITTQPDTVTQFGLVQPPVIGLLAHNTLAGTRFFDLREGVRLWVIEGDGRTQAYRISQRFEYQALEPNSPTSSFKDLASGQILSAAQVFERHYQGTPHVTLQTCIARDGLTTWGRLFVIAEPAP